MRKEDTPEYGIAESFAISKANLMPHVENLIEFLNSPRVEKYWSDKFALAKVTEGIEKLGSSLKEVGDLWTTTEENNPLKPVEKNPLTESEVKNFNLDESDLAVIRILKYKLVRLQLYDVAARLRDIEKDIIYMIDYAKIKRDENYATEKIR